MNFPMKLAQSVQTVIKTTGISVLLLTFVARPLLAHGSEPHSQTPKTPASTSQTAEQEQQSQKVETPVQSHTPNEPMPTTAPDEYSITSQGSTLMPTGLGESIFVLLIGTPLGLFFWKQRR
jgi:hypothetical protein